MSSSQQKISQYVGEAHAMEVSLRRVLQSQIAMTPRGDFREALESHLVETRDHADRLRARQRQLGGTANPVRLVIDVTEAATGQAVALAKTPLDLLRGSGGDEKVLKNAKDACATEALEIATYNAIQDLAEALGDETTAELAVSIRSDEEAMLARITEVMPGLAENVVNTVPGASSFRVSETGAADAARSTARQARRVPGVARAEGEVRGARAEGDADLPIENYDDLNAHDTLPRLADLSAEQLGEIDAYERKTRDRKTVLERIASLRSSDGATA